MGPVNFRTVSAIHAVQSECESADMIDGLCLAMDAGTRAPTPGLASVPTLPNA